MDQKSAKVSITRFLDIERVNCWLSIATHLLTLGTATGVVMGSMLVWRYLNGFGLGHEIMGILGTPHYLLVAAVFALAISAWIMGLVLVVPSLIRTLSNPDYHHIRNRHSGISWLLHALLCFSPMVYLTLIVKFDVTGYMLIVWYLCLLAVLVIAVWFWYGGPFKQEESDKQRVVEWVNYILLVIMAITLLFILLCYGFLLVGELAFRFSDSEYINWLVATVGWVVYSLAITTTVYWRKVMASYLPASVVGMVMFVSFLTNINNNIIASMRIGHFEDTLGVSLEVVQELGDGHGFEISSTKTENVWQIEKVWVIANLPDQIIISLTQGSESKLSIPKKELRPKTHWLN